MPDPFGRAIRDFHRGEQEEPLLQIDGEEAYEHPIEAFYFEPRDPDSEATAWLESRVGGPFLDVDAGVGRDALHIQEAVETTAIEISGHLVAVMDDRGVEDARCADMFALRESFERDRFRTVRSFGTQAALAGSPLRFRRFLGDLASLTTEARRAILDGYDPRTDHTGELLGYRDVPEEGVGFRVFHFEYEGDVGESLLFRLVSPDHLGAACVGTGWTVDEVRYSNDHHYEAVLEKR